MARYGSIERTSHKLATDSYRSGMTDPQQPYGQPPAYPTSGYPPQQFPAQPYPPQQYGPPPGYGQPMYGQPPYPMMQPPKKSNTGKVLAIIGGVVAAIVLVCVGLVALGVVGAKQAQNEADADVTVSSCGTQEMLNAQAGDAVVSITNHSSSTQSYYVTVAFESRDGGVQYDTAFATVDNLGPGQTTTAKASGFKQIQGDMVCKIASVGRI